MVKQGTVNLVIIAAAVIVAAGAWGAPLLTVQTTHSIITAELAETQGVINNNTNAKTSATDDILENNLLGGFGDEQLGNCSMMELMMASSLGQSVDDLCDTSHMLDVIQTGGNFDANKFEFQEEFVETLPGIVLPNENCSTGALFTDSEIIDSVAVVSGNAKGKFGSATCIQPLNGTSAPIGVNLITLNNTDTNNAHDVRLQLAVITNDTASNLCSTDSDAWFANSTSFDAIVNIPAGESKTISSSLNLPPNNSQNLCARIADDGSSTTQYKVWLSGTEFFPLDIFQFVPPVSEVEFNKFTKADFSDTCGIKLKVTDSAGTALKNVPVTLIEPFANQAGLKGIGFGSTVVKTNSTGHVVLGNSTDPSTTSNVHLPSGFFVIDVNVAETNPSQTLSDYGPKFPDQVVSCSNKDAIGIVDLGTVKLAQFGGSGFTGTTIELSVEDSSTSASIAGATVSTTFSSPFTSKTIPDATTDSLGHVTYTNLPPGKYVFSVTASGYSSVSNIVIDVFPGQVFVDRFISMTSTS